MRMKRTKHDLLFRHLGTVAIGIFMREYAEANIKSKDTREQLEHVTQYVNACRVNRNAIVHSWPNLNDSSESITLKSWADKQRPKTREFTVKISDVRRVCEDCETAGLLSVRLQFLFGKGGIKYAKRLLGPEWRASLHAKPALPKLLGVNPHKPQKPKARPRSFRG